MKQILSKHRIVNNDYLSSRHVHCTWSAKHEIDGNRVLLYGVSFWFLKALESVHTGIGDIASGVSVDFINDIIFVH